MKSDRNMKKSSQIISIIYIVLCVWGIKSVDESNVYIYLVSILYFLYSFFYILMVRKGFMPLPCKDNLINIAVFCSVYLVGLFIGLMYGNTTTYAFRNFAGMMLYVASLALSSVRLSENVIKKTIRYMAFFVSIITTFMYLALFVFKIGKAYEIANFPFISSFQAGVQTWGFTIEYYAIVMIFASYGYAIYQIMYYGKYKYIFLMIYDFILLCPLTLSGGRILQIGVLTFLEVTALFLKRPTKMNKFIVLFLWIITAITIPIVFRFVFDATDLGNQRRFIQINYIRNNLRVFGHGLGATYHEIKQGYAIEAIYFDLIYKLGIICIPIFVIYICSFAKCWKCLRKTSGDWLDVMPIVFMGYLFYSMGNPCLFRADSVILHIISLEIIAMRRGERSIIYENTTDRH